MFLEDAEALRTRIPLPYGNFTSHIERYLSGAAIFLRRACEAHFGKGNLGQAPDQQAMHFISAARHIAAHAVVDSFFGEAKKIDARWNSAKGVGEVFLVISPSLDFDADHDGSRQTRDQAKRFLGRHGGDVFLALHSATESVAQWTGARLDDDFRALRHAQLGHARLRAEVTDPVEFKRFVGVATGQGEFTFGSESSLMVVELDDHEAR